MSNNIYLGYGPYLTKKVADQLYPPIGALLNYYPVKGGDIKPSTNGNTLRVMRADGVNYNFLVDTQNQVTYTTGALFSSNNNNNLFKPTTNTTTTMQVQNSAGIEILGVDTTNSGDVRWGNTLTSTQNNGIYFDSFGNVKFKPGAVNGNVMQFQTNGGSTVFSIQNQTAAGGSQIKTFNNTLDDGNGRASFKALGDGSTALTTAFQIQDPNSTPIFNVDTYVGPPGGGTFPTAGIFTFNGKTFIGNSEASEFYPSTDSAKNGHFSINSGGVGQPANFIVDGTSGSSSFQPLTDNANSLQIKNASGTEMVNFDSSGFQMRVKTSSLFKNNANSTSAFQVQNAAGTPLMNIDTQSGINSFSSQLKTSNNMLDDGTGKATFKTNSTSAFQVQNTSGTNVMEVDTVIQDVRYNNTLTSSSSNGTLLNNSGSISFKSLADNFASWKVNTTAGSSALTIKNNTSAGGSQVQTFNNTLDNGTGSMLVKTNTNSANAFEVQNAGGNGIFFVDTNSLGGVRTGGQYCILSSNDTAVQPATTGTFYVQPGGSGSKAIDVTGSTGSTTFRNHTDSANAFRVQNAAAAEIMGIDTVGTGATRFKNNGGSTVLNIANRTTAGGSAITTFNNTLDSGTGNMLVKTNTNSANAFQVQNAAGNSLLNVNSTSGLAEMRVNDFTVRNLAGTSVAFVCASSTGSSIFRSVTDNFNTFSVQNAAAAEIMGIDTTGTGATRFTTNAGSTVLNIANRTTAGGSAITTFNNTLDNGTGDMLVKTNTNSVNAFRIQNNSGTEILGVNTTGTNVSVRSDSMQVRNLVDSASEFNVSDVAGNWLLNLNSTSKLASMNVNDFTVRNLTGSVALSCDLTTGSSLIRSVTNNVNAFQVQNNTAQEIMGIDTTGTGNTRFTTNAGSTVLNIANKTEAGGSAITTFNNTLDNGTGNMLVKTNTNSANAFQVQNAAGNALLNVNSTSGLAEMRVNDFTVRNLAGASVAFACDSSIGSSIFRSVTNTADTFRVQNAAAQEIMGIDTTGIGNTRFTTNAGSTVLNIANRTTAGGSAISTFNNTLDNGTGNMLVKTNPNSATAFTVQNQAGTAAFNVDTLTNTTTTTNLITNTLKLNGRNIYEDILTLGINATSSPVFSGLNIITFSFTSADISFGSNITFTSATNTINLISSGIYKITMQYRMDFSQDNDYQSLWIVPLPTLTVNLLQRVACRAPGYGLTVESAKITHLQDGPLSFRLYTSNYDTSGTLAFGGDGRIMIEKIT